MANLVGFKPLADQEWISLEFDDGTVSNPVNDPTGEYRAQVNEIARKVAGVPPDPMAGAVASLGGELAEGAGSAMARADVPASLAPSPRPGLPAVASAAPTPAPAAAAQAGDRGRVESAIKMAIKPQPEPAMPGGAAPAQPGQPGPSPAPVPQPAGAGAARPPGLVVTDTSSSWQKTENEQRSTSGIAEADRPGVAAANEAAVKAAETANNEEYVAKATQYWHEFGRLSEDAKRQVAERGVLQEQERKFNESLNTAYKKLDSDAARPIDPAQAFAGEKGWYAFMAGFGDVLRNVGSALAGKGPVVDPGAVLDQLVERSVNLQMAQKEQDLKAGRIGVDRLTADRETVRHRLGVVLSQLATTELQKAQTEQAYQALGAVKAKGDAIVADARAKAATAMARQETVAESTSKVSGGTVQRGLPKPAGGTSLDDISKLYDIEKKKLELENAQLDRVDAQQASQIVGTNMSPQRLEKLRASLKENAPVMAKLDSFLSALQAQLTINGATVDRNTGDIKWGDDVGGVGYGKLHEMGAGGKALAEAFNTKGLQLEQQQAFLSQLVTNDVTGAVSTLQQDEVFKQATGGAGRNPEQYKQALQKLAKYAIERRQGLLAPLGEDGIKLYRHNEQLARQGLAPGAKQIGTLPVGQQ